MAKEAPIIPEPLESHVLIQISLGLTRQQAIQALKQDYLEKYYCKHCFRSTIELIHKKKHIRICERKAEDAEKKEKLARELAKDMAMRVEKMKEDEEWKLYEEEMARCIAADEEMETETVIVSNDEKDDRNFSSSSTSKDEFNFIITPTKLGMKYNSPESEISIGGDSMSTYVTVDEGEDRDGDDQTAIRFEDVDNDDDDESMGGLF